MSESSTAPSDAPTDRPPRPATIVTLPPEATNRLALGLTDRAATVADAALILPLVLACDAAVEGDSDSSLDEVTSMLGFPGVDNERGGRLVLDLAGHVVGWLWAELEEGELFVDVYARDPAISAWLFERGIRYARELSADRAEPLDVRAGCYAQDVAYADVIRSYGLAVDRRFLRMRRELDPQQPFVAPPRPAGVTIEIAPTDPAGLHLLHRLHETSFVDHWNHTAHDFDTWLARVTASTGDDPQQRYVAYVDDEPAGLLIADESMAEHGESYVRTLGVLREFRGRGVAQALLANAFEQAQRRGRSTVSLTVDSASPTGATRLYDGMGMSVTREILMWHGTL